MSACICSINLFSVIPPSTRTELRGSSKSWFIASTICAWAVSYDKRIYRIEDIFHKGNISPKLVTHIFNLSLLNTLPDLFAKIVNGHYNYVPCNHYLHGNFFWVRFFLMEATGKISEIYPGEKYPLYSTIHVELY